jgi:hypothetical protein
MHSQAVDFTCTKLVLEPGNKLMFGASLATSDASECVSVHSLDVEVRSNSSVILEKNTLPAEAAACHCVISAGKASL